MIMTLDLLIGEDMRMTAYQLVVDSFDDIVEIEIDMWSIAWIFEKGHRIGLHISSSNYPRFDVNPNTGAEQPLPGEEMRVARERVHSGKVRAGALLLPVPVK